MTLAKHKQPVAVRFKKVAALSDLNAALKNVRCFSARAGKNSTTSRDRTLGSQRIRLASLPLDQVVLDVLS